MATVSATFQTEVAELVERELTIVAGQITWASTDKLYATNGDYFPSLLHRLTTVYDVVFPVTTQNYKYKFCYDRTNEKVLVYVQDATSGIYAEVANGTDLYAVFTNGIRFIAFGWRY